MTKFPQCTDWHQPGTEQISVTEKPHFLQHNKNQGLILMLQIFQFMICQP